MIPKIIHQIWIGPLPPPQAMMDTWRRKHPDWEYKVWRDHTGWENQSQIDAMSEWNGRADIMRYEILERFGGILVDADSICVQALDDSFLEHKAFACWENEIVRPGLIAAGYVGAEKGSRFMRACINAIKTRSLAGCRAWETVGPGLLTTVAKDHPELHVYPARTFIPMHYSGTEAPGDARVYAQQFWGSTFGYDKISVAIKTDDSTAGEASDDISIPGSTVCLVAIVKDEEPVIERCLRSVLPIIDAWSIVDTGSTDRTKEIVRDVLKDVPGELHERPWMNFAYNRTEMIALAMGKADYDLMVDADDVIDIAPDFRMPKLTLDAYDVSVLYGNLAFRRPHIFRNDRNLRFEGVVHEFLGGHASTGILDGIVYRVVGGGARGRDAVAKYERDAEILQLALRGPESHLTARYMFYLAQSFKDAAVCLLERSGTPEEKIENRHKAEKYWRKALKAYERRAARKDGYGGEKFVSLMEIAKHHVLLKSPESVVRDAFLRAYEEDSHRAAEPLFYLSRYYRFRNRFALGYLYAKAGSNIPVPQGHFVEHDAYRWGALDEMAVSAYHTNRFTESRDINRRLLESSVLPPGEVPRIQDNLRFSLESLGEKPPAPKAYVGPMVIAGPLVTVVIPCFQQARFLGDAIRSVLAQSYKDIEIVVAAGDKESLDVASKFAGRTQLLRSKIKLTGLAGLDHGLADARNEAIKYSSGEYILPLDADDIIAPDFLAMTVPFANEETIVGADLQEFGARSRRIAPTEATNYMEENPLFVCSLFPRALWDKVGGYNVAPFGYEDWCFWISCLKVGAKYRVVHEPIFRYRIHAGQDSSFCLKHDAILQAMLRNIQSPGNESDLQTIRAMPDEVRERMMKRRAWFPNNRLIASWLERS
jgi:glycosyltransferase involved in cell wall biosynthesis